MFKYDHYLISGSRPAAASFILDAHGIEHGCA
jgi:hypothetical protein